MIDYWETFVSDPELIVKFICANLVLAFLWIIVRNVLARIILLLVLLSIFMNLGYISVAYWFFTSLPTVIVFIFLYNILFRRKQGAKVSRVENTEHNFLLSRKKETVEIANPYRGVLIMGGAGSGKTASLITPILESVISKGFTGIVYDFKCPDLSNMVYTMASRQNTKKAHYFFLNFKDLSRTHRVNPLAIIDESAHARELAVSLVSNLMPESITRPEFFSRSAVALLAGAIWFMHEEHPDQCTLPHVVSLLLWNDPTQLVEKICENDLAKDIVASVRSGLTSEKQTAGVISTLQMSLSILSNKKLFYILSGNDFSLDLNDPENPKFLCVGNDSSLIDTLSPVISLIVTAALKQMNKPGKEKSVVLLDEAPTLYIPNFDQIPATARSNKVATVFCAQDYSQLEDKYGTTKAEVILSNLANQFWGKTTNPKTADKVVKLFGKYDKKFLTSSSGSSSQGFLKGSTNKSTSETIQERNRVTITDIRDLVPGQFYASLVETQQNEWKYILDYQEYPDSPVPSFSSIDQLEIDRVFAQIKQNIKEIMTTVTD